MNLGKQKNGACIGMSIINKIGLIYRQDKFSRSKEKSDMIRFLLVWILPLLP